MSLLMFPFSMRNLHLIGLPYQHHCCLKLEFQAARCDRVSRVGISTDIYFEFSIPSVPFANVDNFVLVKQNNPTGFRSEDFTIPTRRS